MQTVEAYSVNPHGFLHPDFREEGGRDRIGPFERAELPVDVFAQLSRDERMMSVREYNDEYLPELSDDQLRNHAQVRRKYTDEDIDTRLGRDKLIEALRLDADEGDG